MSGAVHAANVGAASGQTLYAVAHETWLPGRQFWQPGITYVHAWSPGDAKWKYANSIPGHVELRIVGAAEPVGRWVNDSQGNQLSL